MGNKISPKQGLVNGFVYIVNSNLGNTKTGIDLDNFKDFFIGTLTSTVNSPINGTIYIINIPGNVTGRAYQQIMSVGNRKATMMYRRAFNDVWKAWETSITNSDFTINGFTNANIEFFYEKDGTGYYLRLTSNGKNLAFWRVSGVYQ